MVTEVGGYLWSDARKAAAVLRDAAGIARWIGYCPQRRECVQAGANVGVFPKVLANHFETVYAAELDATNYADMIANGLPANVHTFHAALGDKAGQVGRYRAELPISHYVVPGGDIPMLAIDGWSLQHCDLIALDVEGYEWPALKGAVETIERCHPLLVIETKGHGVRYGYADADMASWLTGLGYTLVDRVNKDDVWRWE